MRISDLIGKRIGLLGLGREGLASLETLRRRGHSEPVDVFMDGPIPSNPPVGIRLHTNPDAFADVDVVIRSPGFSPGHRLRLALDRFMTTQVTATQLFLREIRDNELTVIGVTASKGKSTTSALLHLVLQHAGLDTALVGNIGVPALELIDQILNRRQLVVMEMSSYQCMDLASGYAPPVAVLGTLFPEHLDYHGATSNYYYAKAMIATMQRDGDRFFCHRDSTWILDGLITPGRMRQLQTTDGLHYADGHFMRGNTKLFAGNEMRLLGDHNRENAVTALTVAEDFGATVDDLHAVVRDFPGLLYRLQDEGYRGGIRWINDSISTAPEATAAAVRAVGQEGVTLIVGGFDRGNDVSPLLMALEKSSIRHVILLPATGGKIAANIRERRLEVICHEVSNIACAVNIAKEVTPIGRICLFSPGAPSYTFFRDFMERGKTFRREISRIV